MDSLIERIEAATGPDRELDAEIGRALGWRVLYDDSDPNDREPYYQPVADLSWTALPRYTASIDAAMGLVPNGKILRQYMVSRFVPHSCEVAVSYAHGGWVGHSDHSFALALCSAALKARTIPHDR